MENREHPAQNALKEHCGKDSEQALRILRGVSALITGSAQELPAVDRERLRRQGIQAREQLTKAEREARSGQAAQRILSSAAFQAAETVLLYRAVRGEVRLHELEAAARSARKRLAWPVCLNGHKMAAFCPKDETAWTKGRYGIEEPVPACSVRIEPGELDLVICPCTVFDEACNRMGMGAGFYDRYLPQCKNAHIIAAAFEIQKAAQVPAMPWDYPLEAVYTDKRIYWRES